MKKQNKKKIIITVTAVVLVVAIGLGVWFGVSRGRSEPVKVFAFNRRATAPSPRIKSRPCFFPPPRR